MHTQILLKGKEEPHTEHTQQVFPGVDYPVLPGSTFCSHQGTASCHQKKCIYQMFIILPT